jgi:hypothetical protein
MNTHGRPHTGGLSIMTINKQKSAQIFFYVNGIVYISIVMLMMIETYTTNQMQIVNNFLKIVAQKLSHVK